MIRFLVMRHGETTWNAQGRIQGQLDTLLNERGHDQAQAVGRALAEENIDELWSSDLARAMDTASALPVAARLAIKQDARLRERHFGILQGMTYADAETRHPEQFAGYHQSVPSENFQCGESLTDFYQRATGFFVSLAETTAPNCTIAVATHGGVVSCLYRFANRIPLGEPRKWPMPNAAINEFLFDAGTWQVVRFADVRHLDAALDDVG
jgi:2,3-bisphosphoglycerate-dependent phosphoglycerate mutase